ncbi:MAG: permease [Phycisphaerae bacterium]|nr:permease [Phycisphaerae bacterium]
MSVGTTQRMSRGDKIKIALLVALVAAVPAWLVLPWVQRCLEDFFSEARAQVFGQVLIAILLEAFPFVLAGAILSAVIEVLVPAEKLARLIPKSLPARLAVAPLLGLIFPVCECGVVPVVRRLIKKGLPLEMAVVYLLTAPIVNPIVLASTALAFSRTRLWWMMPAARAGLGIVVAVAVGLVLLVAQRRHPAPAAPAAPPSPCGGESVLVHILHHTADDFLLLGGFLLFGSLIAAAAQAFVPRTILVSIGQKPFVASAGMMALAFVLNLCSEADAFVAASFVQFTFASKLAFLVLGPMLDIKLVAMYLGALPRRILVIVLLVVPPLVLVLSELVGRILEVAG